MNNLTATRGLYVKTAQAHHVMDTYPNSVNKFMALIR